jgi:hypothetical protein
VSIKDTNTLENKIYSFTEIKKKKKMWYLYTMEFYVALKKNEIFSVAGKWMELENIILSEISQVQKPKGHMLSVICGI